MQLAQPSQGATQHKRQEKRQCFIPFTQLFIPVPKSPIEQVWQIGAQTVQQHAPQLI
jgi:hypothetical protein